MQVKELEKMLLPELKAAAKKEGLKGYSGLRKRALYDLLVMHYSKKNNEQKAKPNIIQSFKKEAKNIMAIAQSDLEQSYIRLHNLEKQRNNILADINNKRLHRLFRKQLAKELNIINFICSTLHKKLKRLECEIVVNPLIKKTCTVFELQQYAKQLYVNSAEKHDYTNWFEEVFTDTAFYDEVI